MDQARRPRNSVHSLMKMFQSELKVVWECILFVIFQKRLMQKL